MNHRDYGHATDMVSRASSGIGRKEGAFVFKWRTACGVSLALGGAADVTASI
jgi:hypothetical protein